MRNEEWIKDLRFGIEYIVCYPTRMLKKIMKEEVEE